MNGIKITLFALFIVPVFTFAITQVLILEYPFASQKRGKLLKWICTIANILFNSFVLYKIATQLNLIEMIHFTCSYQDISRLATSNMISFAGAILIGLVLRACVCRFYQDDAAFRPSGKCVLLLMLAAVPILLGYYESYSGSSQLAIHEICRKTTAIDAENVDDDEVCYVGVINNGVLSYELDQIYLSDQLDRLQDQQFPQQITLKPGESYRFCMASGDSLDIKKAGGTIVYLSDKFGNVVDEREVPALKQNESYENSGTGWQIVKLAEEKEIIPVSAPLFSREGGFYDGPFELELSADPGTTIYYTLDCSDPTIGSTEYSQPIHVYDRSGDTNSFSAFTGVRPVDKCFVVRAVAVDRDQNYSDVITKSYFINQDKYKNDTVVSLVSDPEGLFGDEYGICVNGKAYDEWYSENVNPDGTIDRTNAPARHIELKGIEWERESNLEVFENTGLLLTQPVGIRVQGGGARYLALKRFSIYARDEYSASEYFDVDLINDHSQHVVYTREGPMHALSQVLGRDRNVATVDFIAVTVFLDGEFWYTTYLYEKFNEKNFSQKYNLTTDNIVIAKHGTARGNTSMADLEAGKNPLSGIANFINKNDLSDDENYFKYNEILDIQSYIDWACINIFLQNVDYNERANNLFWHTVIPENRQEGDGRWKLGLYDMDLNWGAMRDEYRDLPSYEINPFKINVSWQPGPITKWPIYSALRQNEHFCRQFVLTFMDLINTNCSADNIMVILERLGITRANYREFFEKRASYIIPYMAEEFELIGTRENVTISSNISGTPVTLNTIAPELKQSNGTFSWTGSYFTDYPVTVAANAPRFSYWEVTAGERVQTFTDETIEVPVSRGGVQIRAIFK